MSKTLVNLLGWVPVLGQSLKVAYVSKSAYEVVNNVKFDPQKAELKGTEMEKYISDLSQDAYEEFLQDEIDELGLPSFVSNSAKEKAIAIISGKLKEKYLKKVV